MKTTIVNAWNWFCNILDTQTLTASEQLLLLHIMKFLNRNYWEPMDISISALSRSCGKDARTVKENLTRLQTKNLIFVTEVGIYLGFDPPKNAEPKKATSPSFSKKNSAKPKGNAKTKLSEAVEGITPPPAIKETLIKILRDNGGKFTDKKDLDYFNSLNKISQKQILNSVNVLH